MAKGHLAAHVGCVAMFGARRFVGGVHQRSNSHADAHDHPHARVNGHPHARVNGHAGADPHTDARIDPDTFGQTHSPL